MILAYPHDSLASRLPHPVWLGCQGHSFLSPFSGALGHGAKTGKWRGLVLSLYRQDFLASLESYWQDLSSSEPANGLARVLSCTKIYGINHSSVRNFSSSRLSVLGCAEAAL